jgi:hypothetical protein
MLGYCVTHSLCHVVDAVPISCRGAARLVVRAGVLVVLLVCCSLVLLFSSSILPSSVALCLLLRAVLSKSGLLISAPSCTSAHPRVRLHLAHVQGECCGHQCCVKASLALLCLLCIRTPMLGHSTAQATVTAIGKMNAGFVKRALAALTL